MAELLSLELWNPVMIASLDKYVLRFVWIVFDVATTYRLKL